MENNQQELQENQYSFPYHYIPEFSNERFLQTRNVGWGLVYASYIVYIAEVLRQLHFENLLDVGCGDGRFLFEVKKLFPDRTFEGIDYSESAIGFARAFNPNLTIHVGDILSSDVASGTYDVITLIETLEHIAPEECSAFLASVAKRLSEDGTFILTVPSTNIPLFGKHFRHFDSETLAQTLAPHFSIDRLLYVNKKGWLETVLLRILSNRLFILNSVRISTLIYRFYRKHLFFADEKTGVRIVAFCHKTTAT